MPENFESIIGYGLLLLTVLFWVVVLCRLAVKLYRDRYTPVRTVKGRIADKYLSDRLARLYGSAAGKAGYVVVFEAKEKTLSFRVSELTYHSLKVGQKGTLRYKGSRWIDFH